MVVTPTLANVEMNLVRAREPVVGRVTYNELCMRGKSASFVKHLEIDVTDTALAGNFAAGQSFGVVTPGIDDNGKPHKIRLYSIACPTWGEDGKGNVVSTTPKRLIDEHTPQRPTDDATNHRLFLGVCSNYLCDLKPGDEVRLTGPKRQTFSAAEIPRRAQLSVCCYRHRYRTVSRYVDGITGVPPHQPKPNRPGHGDPLPH